MVFDVGLLLLCCSGSSRRVVLPTDFHDNNWLHRDVKAANLLVDEDGTVLLADFGVSSLIASKPKGRDDFSSVSSRKSFVGTPNWMAPEVVEQKSYDFKGRSSSLLRRFNLIDHQ